MVRAERIPRVVAVAGLVLAALLLQCSTASAAACAPRSSSYSSAVSGTAGVAGYWRLGEGSGSVACDSSAGARNGSYQAGTTLSLAGALAGDPDTAAGFNGAGGWVSVPDSPAFASGDRFSVEAWVRRGSVSGTESQVVASKQSGSWVLMFNSTNRLVLRRAKVADVAASTRTVTDTAGWHHVAATKDGSAVHLYLDGVDVTGTVANQTMSNNTQPLAIGQSSSTAYFDGAIDEVAVYAGALTANQLASRYKAGAAAAAADPVIGAAGDIACASSSSAFNGGLGTPFECRQKYTSDLLVNSGLSAVLPLGDEQYDAGTLSEFGQSYDPTWGRLNGIAHPAVGNHEYHTPGAAGYFDYFDGVGRATGPAGDRTKGYYSFDVGAWHLVALNSNCSFVACAAGSAQEQWLKRDLAAHPNRCTLAYWHHPRFSSGSAGNAPSTGPLWQDLYSAGADVALGGHSHSYERFAPQTPSATPDPVRGVRQFVVGSGGKSHYPLGTVQPNSEVRNFDTFGVLRLTLRPTGYDWRFVPEAGARFTDSGSQSCH